MTTDPMLPETSLSSFRSVLDGVADDTAAFQRAVDFIVRNSLVGQSRLIINGKLRFNPQAVDWSAFKLPPYPRMTMIVDGKLILMSPLVLENRVSLTGVGGASKSAQFQIGPCCSVVQEGTWTEPAIRLQGSGDLAMNGVYVSGCYGPGIQIGYLAGEANQTALCRLENVGVLTRAGVATSEGLRLENAFWVWVRNFAFNSQLNSGPSIHFADSYNPGAGKNTGGLTHLEQGVIAGEGIWLNRAPSLNQTAYHFEFRDIHHEAPRSSFCVVKSPDVNYRDVRFYNVNMADPVEGTELALIDNSVGGKIHDVDISRFNTTWANSRLTIGRVGTSNYKAETFRSFVYAGKTYDNYRDIPYNFEMHADGEVEQIDGFRGGQLGPAMVPADAIVLHNQPDMTLWAKTPETSVASGAPSPDGLNAGFTLSSPAGQHGVYLDRNGAQVTDHYMIIGAWFRSINPANAVTVQAANILELYQSSANVGYWDGDPGNNSSTFYLGQSSARVQQRDYGWVFISGVKRFTSPQGAALLRFMIRSSSSQSFHVYNPFVVALPASSYARRDVSRILSKLAFIDISAKPGTLHQMPHQTFRTGIGESAARPDPAKVGVGAQWFDATLGRPVWSTGAVWVDAAGVAV